MGFLKLFNKDIENEEEEDEEDEPIISMMKRKKETMDGVLQTTVLETVINDFHKLKIAQISYQDDDMFIGLLLRAEDIGGLNRKSSKDRSEMIQQIVGGDIKVYISDELLKREELLLVPDAETWENIGEYKFMREAPYTIQYIDEEGTLYDTKQQITYHEIENAIRNQNSLKTFVKKMPDEAVEEEQTISDEEKVVEENDEQIVQEADEEINEEIVNDDIQEDLNAIPENMDEDDEWNIDEEEDGPDFDVEEDMTFLEEENEDFSEESSVSEDQFTATESFMDSSAKAPQGMQFASVSDVMDQMSEETEPEEDEFSYEYDESFEEENDIEVSEEDVESTIFRKFYSDELGLEISMTPFNSEFVNKSDIIPFITDRPQGWMNEQLNEKSARYNQEIEQLHQLNVSKLRILYTKLMQESVDKIRVAVDINTVTNYYGEKYNELLLKKNNYDIVGEIEAYKEKLIRDWEEKLQQIGQDAANVAIQKHKEKYERQHEDELYMADTYLRDKLENEFQDMLRDLNNKRKLKAQELLERYTDSVLKAVADEYLQMQDNEAARIKEIQQELEKFVDDYRKDDIAMAEVRQNEQRYKERLEEQLAIHRNEIETYKRELEQKERQYRTEMDNSVMTHKKIMDEKENEYNTEITKLKNKNTELKELYDELNEKYQKIDETKRSEYEGQIDQIRSANIALEEEMRAQDVEHKRKSSGIVILIIVCIVAALAIGFMIGTVMSSPSTQNSEISIEESK